MPDTWIPVSERLPAEQEHVIVTDGRRLAIGWRMLDYPTWTIPGFAAMENRVSHWQPLPAPPTPPNARSE